MEVPQGLDDVRQVYGGDVSHPTLSSRLIDLRFTRGRLLLLGPGCDTNRLRRSSSWVPGRVAPGLPFLASRQRSVAPLPVPPLCRLP